MKFFWPLSFLLLFNLGTHKALAVDKHGAEEAHERAPTQGVRGEIIKELTELLAEKKGLSDLGVSEALAKKLGDETGVIVADARRTLRFNHFVTLGTPELEELWDALLRAEDATPDEPRSTLHQVRRLLRQKSGLSELNIGDERLARLIDDSGEPIVADVRRMARRGGLKSLDLDDLKAIRDALESTGEGEKTSLVEKVAAERNPERRYVNGVYEAAPRFSSQIGLDPGQEITIQDLLAGLRTHTPSSDEARKIEAALTGATYVSRRALDPNNFDIVMKPQGEELLVDNSKPRDAFIDGTKRQQLPDGRWTDNDALPKLKGIFLGKGIPTEDVSCVNELCRKASESYEKKGYKLNLIIAGHSPPGGVGVGTGQLYFDHKAKTSNLMIEGEGVGAELVIENLYGKVDDILIVGCESAKKADEYGPHVYRSLALGLSTPDHKVTLKGWDRLLSPKTNWDSANQRYYGGYFGWDTRNGETKEANLWCVTPK